MENTDCMMTGLPSHGIRVYYSTYCSTSHKQASMRT